MAIQNRDAPAIVKTENFDPGKVGPREIVIVEEAGERHAYIGLSVGEPVRIATHAELKSFGNDARLAANEVADARAAITVQIREATKLQEKQIQEAAYLQERARQAVERTEQAQKAAETAQEAAERAERALASINAAISNFSMTLATSLTTLAISLAEDTTETGGGA